MGPFLENTERPLAPRHCRVAINEMASSLVKPDTGLDDKRILWHLPQKILKVF